MLRGGQSDVRGVVRIGKFEWKDCGNGGLSQSGYIQSQIPKRGLAVSGRNGIPSGRMEDKQRSMRIDEMSGVTRQTRAPE